MGRVVKFEGILKFQKYSKLFTESRNFGIHFSLDWIQSLWREKSLQFTYSCQRTKSIRKRQGSKKAKHQHSGEIRRVTSIQRTKTTFTRIRKTQTKATIITTEHLVTATSSALGPTLTKNQRQLPPPTSQDHRKIANESSRLKFKIKSVFYSCRT